ncbi:MAG: alpha/beta hydrolase [Chitinophagaceae bacterium]|nr:MAG: alpha/beta hydrolase [Chitinophagaceae bacterium]
MLKNLCLLLLLPFFGFSQQGTLVNLDSTLSQVAYPFEVRSLQLQNQRQTLQMAYMDVKPANPNGAVVLLLHGKNFNGAYWQNTIEKLSSLGYRVVAPDQVGFGKSSKPSTYQYSFHQLAENTKTLLDSLGIPKAMVLGHSMGGMLAARFALMYPGSTQKLILENPIGLEDYKVMTPYQSIEKNYRNELSQTYDKIKKYQLTNYYDGKWKPQYDRWVNLLAGWTINEHYPIMAWNAALTSDMIFTQPVLYELNKIQVPTLLIIGTRDRTAIGKTLVSEQVRKTMGQYQLLGKQTQKKIRNCQLVELKNVGHLPHIEVFEEFMKALLPFIAQPPQLN